jgi:hypothetical protein
MTRRLLCAANSHYVSEEPKSSAGRRDEKDISGEINLCHPTMSTDEKRTLPPVIGRFLSFPRKTDGHNDRSTQNLVWILYCILLF